MDRETPSWITGLFLGLVVVGTLWGSGAAWTAQVTLAWDPNREADLAGYRLYRGRSSGVFDRTVDVGNVTTFTDGDLQTEVAYYYVVTAYNTAGLESDPSNVLELTMPLRLATTTISRGGPGQSVLGFSVSAVTGRQVALQRSTDLLTWTTCLTAAAGLPLSCQVTNNPGQVRQFYRAICLP